MGRVSLHTLGCKLNFAETASLTRQFTDRGYDVVEFGSPADVVVLNTCTVTERADRECRQLVRRALRRSPGAYVIVTGCYAQLKPQVIGSIEGVDLVLGSREKLHLFDHAGFVKTGDAVVKVSNLKDLEGEISMADSADLNERTRAFVKIQDGCDYHCSFCTIPLARGGSRSVPAAEVISRVRHVAEDGYKEIVLTGVNVGDYGNDAHSLLSLLKELVLIDGIARIRVSSIEPNLLTDELLRFWMESEKICNHFHLPLQSGSDHILKVMRRRYQRTWYEGRMEEIIRTAPDACIGADVIVGFPGESEAEFEETYRFIADRPFSYLHVFTYSERENTDAQRMQNSVDPRIRSERSERLRILSEKKRAAFYSKQEGRIVSVLFETPASSEMQTGFSEEYVRVNVESTMNLENTIRSVRILGVAQGACVGILSDRLESQRAEQRAVA